jgi:hypothetical protein
VGMAPSIRLDSPYSTGKRCLLYSPTEIFRRQLVAVIDAEMESKMAFELRECFTTFREEIGGIDISNFKGDHCLFEVFPNGH